MPFGGRRQSIPVVWMTVLISMCPGSNVDYLSVKDYVLQSIPTGSGYIFSSSVWFVCEIETMLQIFQPNLIQCCFLTPSLT